MTGSELERRGADRPLGERWVQDAFDRFRAHSWLYTESSEETARGWLRSWLTAARDALARRPLTAKRSRTGQFARVLLSRRVRCRPDGARESMSSGNTVSLALSIGIACSC
jgi:hypothetical protein